VREERRCPDGKKKGAEENPIGVRWRESSGTKGDERDGDERIGGRIYAAVGAL